MYETDDIADRNPPTEREIMALLFTESAMFLAAIHALDAHAGDDVNLVSYLLHMLHLATARWMEPQ